MSPIFSVLCGKLCDMPEKDYRDRLLLIRCLKKTSVLLFPGSELCELVDKIPDHQRNEEDDQANISKDYILFCWFY